MRTRAVQLLLCAALVAVAALTAFTLPASAEKRTIYVKLVTGQVVPITVDVPAGTPLDQIELPGIPVAPGTPSEPKPEPKPEPADPAPKPGSGSEQPRSGKKKRKKPKLEENTDQAEPELEAPTPKKKRPRRTRLRNPDGSPAPTNPGFMDALPGPSFTTGVPNFVIRKFRVPVFLLPIYQAAGIQYGIRWEILAAINEIETDYGRNLNVSSAGALGWMQFIPSSWRAYGTDANKDGKKDPYNPVDAIFAAARYLKAAGYEQDVRRSIFAYNHADWYVDSVMLRARLIAGVPADLVGSLTGLTEGRFPIAARARYADDLQEKAATKRVKAGQNAANVIEDKDGRRSVEIFAKEDSPAVATNDGVVKKIGRSDKLGRYLILQDVYGNRYMYAGLVEVSQFYPVPKADPSGSSTSVKVVRAREKRDPKPSGAASSGRQPKPQREKPESHDVAADEPPAVKERLFAHPSLPGSRENGGFEQIMEAQSGDSLETYDGRFARPIKLDPEHFELRPLRRGAHVIGGTVLGRVGTPEKGKGAHLDFSIRPAGKGAPRIDPKPILDGWKLIEDTAIYRASGRNALRTGDGGGSYWIG